MLNIKDLKLSINNTKILNGVTFSVSEGERLGIIGPNGSGKTTLFNCLNGFHYPDSGDIRFCDKSIAYMPAFERAKLGIGRVFQNFGIFREMTVFENILTALESKHDNFFGSGLLCPWGGKNKERRTEAMEHLLNIGLADRAHAKAGSLSGGQMRLLEITRTIAFGAKLFLLDEPTAGISPKMKHEVEKALKHLEETKRTILIIEHDINFIQKLCDRIIVLDVGQVVLDGTPEEIRNNPQLHDIYFGSEST